MSVLQKNAVMVFLFCVCSISAMGQSYRAVVRVADSLYGVKDYERSTEVYARAFAMKKDVASDLYNGACAAALAGKRDRAFEWLNGAIGLGWSNVGHLRKDSDLVSLHDTKAWAKLVDDLQRKVDLIESKYNKPLQQELLAIYEDDQRIRNAYVGALRKAETPKHVTDSLRKVVIYKDSINLIKVTKILDQHGWLGPDVVGEQATMALFLVIQHSDLPVQEKYFPMIKKAAAEKRVNRQAFALLEDRIAVRQGRKQIYGSQIGTDEKTGKSYLFSIEDPFHVDKRREEIGLEPLADYVKKWDIVWDPKTHALENRTVPSKE